jgi:hypothetical protein
MGRHFSVVLAGNGVARLVGTFFKHASTLDKVSGIGRRANLPAKPPLPIYILLKMLPARRSTDF